MPCKQRFIALPTRERNHQTCRYNSEYARNVEGFGKKIDKKRSQYFVEDVCDGVLVTQPTKHCVDGREGKACDNSHCHAAYKKHRE